MNVRAVSDGDPVQFAASEVARYLQFLLPERQSSKQQDASETIRVGTAESIPVVDIPHVDDERFEDVVHVDVDENGHGVIVGNTDRAVLQAAYRYLRELGCRWVRPGPDGEVIPDLAALPAVSLTETPAYRHRSMHLGGNVTAEELREMIAWGPKVGYNGVIIEFHEGETFKKARDRRLEHPAEPSEPLSEEAALSLHRVAVEEIERRGLVYHAVGHNWTAWALDMPNQPREDDLAAVPEDKREFLAELDGERQLFRRGPLDTELCYSNDAARDAFVDAVVEYATEHPEIDVLHVWLSDGHNNHCECEDCRGTRPSDFYVQLLNEVDAALTASGCDHAVAFLAYTDLLWPPVEEALEDSDRFILMFAPIRRDYIGDFESIEPVDIPTFERNDNEFPTDVSENVAFLRAWQEHFDGDGFVFDYHFWRAHFRDPGSFQISELVATDMRALREIGLNGSVSCNGRRVFWPTGLGMAVTAAVLWNDERPFETFASDYLSASFGADAAIVGEYLADVSEAFDQEYLARRPGEEDAPASNRFAEIPDIVAGFRPTLASNREFDCNARAESWAYLRVQADVCEGLATALAALANGEDEEATAAWESLKETLREESDDSREFLDLHQFERTYEPVFAIED